MTERPELYRRCPLCGARRGVLPHALKVAVPERLPLHRYWQGRPRKRAMRHMSARDGQVNQLSPRGV